MSYLLFWRLRKTLLPHSDIYCAAHLMLHEYSDGAELEAVQCADRMHRRGDREETLTWFRIWRTIAAMRQASRGLPRPWASASAAPARRVVSTPTT